MKAFVLLSVFCLVLIGHVTCSTTFLYLFSEAEVEQYGARCLDGSPSGFYYQLAPAGSVNADKWFIVLEAGGYCLPNGTAVDGLEYFDCYQRAQTPLGSSTTWAATSDSTTTGLMPPSTDGSWNFIDVPYCGGDVHSGTRTTSFGGLYYAGHLTVVAMLNKALTTQFGIGSATTVVFGGQSAGGIGTFVNIDTAQELLPNANVIAFPNAGWFLDVKPYVYYPSGQGTSDLPTLYVNAQSYVNQLCKAGEGDTPWNCFGAQFAYPYVTAPTFIAQSWYDIYQSVSYGCAPESYTCYYSYKTLAENSWFLNFYQTMNSTFSTEVFTRPQDGYFITSDSNTHVLAYSMTVNGITLDQTFHNYVTGTGIWKVQDPCPYPHEACLNNGACNAIAGLTGQTGQTGVSGVTGFTGVTGQTGTYEPTGFTGATGSNNPAGANGFTGVTGFTGEDNPKGADNPTGFTGPTGYTGFTGPDN